MKFIVNSKHFAHTITEAISENVALIKCDEKELVFQNPYKCISIYVHYKETQSWDIVFDIFQWFEIVKVLQKIPEQPITVYIDAEFIDICMEYRFKSHLKELQ